MNAKTKNETSNKGTFDSLMEENQKANARKVQARVAADNAAKNNRTLWVNASPETGNIGYGKAGTRGAITGPNMGAYTTALMESLGWIRVSATGNVTATRKKIDVSMLRVCAGSAVARHWVGKGRIDSDAGKLTAKGLNMLGARAIGESVSKSKETTTAATSKELIAKYRAYIRGGKKGTQAVPFNPVKVTIAK